MKTKSKHQPGFTLLELVVVISIIAILVAVALPRLIETQREARVAKTQALYGALRSAATLARTRCELDLSAGGAASGSDCRSTPPLVLMDGHPVRIVNRFPSATAEGIDVAADINLSAEGYAASNGTEANSLGMNVPSRTFKVSGGGTARCEVTYLEAGLKGEAVVGAEVRVATDGC